MMRRHFFAQRTNFYFITGTAIRSSESGTFSTGKKAGRFQYRK